MAVEFRRENSGPFDGITALCRVRVPLCGGYRVILRGNNSPYQYFRLDPCARHGNRPVKREQTRNFCGFRMKSIQALQFQGRYGIFITLMHV